MYDKPWGLYRGNAGGRARAASAYRDNRGRFLMGYGFVDPAELERRLQTLERGGDPAPSPTVPKRPIRAIQP